VDDLDRQTIGAGGLQLGAKTVLGAAQQYPNIVLARGENRALILSVTGWETMGTVAESATYGRLFRIHLDHFAITVVTAVHADAVGQLGFAALRTRRR
jgi:hypothetical protein